MPPPNHIATIEMHIFREIFEDGMDAMLIIDSNGLIACVNRKLESAFGYSREELVGRGMDLLVPERDDVLSAGRLPLLPSEPETPGAMVISEGAVRCRDGSMIPVEIALAELGSGEGRVVAVWLRDLSERRTAHLEIQRTSGDLELKSAQCDASEKDLRIFAETASHDLQAPLRQIMQFLNLIERRGQTELSPQSREYIGFAIEAARRAQSLVRDILSYSLVGSSGRAFDSVALDDVLHDVLDVLRVQLDEAGAVVKRGPLPAVTGDRVQLTQLLQNLIANAVVHRGEAPPEIEVSARLGVDGPVISVSDKGKGIDPTHHEQVFELFHRVGGAGALGGTGVGLAICRRVVERHGGQIWIDSRPGQGCRFSFVLRAAADPVAGPSNSL